MVSRVASSAQVQWPQFKVSLPDPVLGEVFSGKAGMSPEQSLLEFISTSASFHGVKKQPLRSLEWDLLKVFTNNVMPANAAAWYMAKRKFYMDQAFDQQLLPFLLKKFPDKFKVIGDQVVFLEVYSKEAAKEKLLYLVQQGLNAYFNHKADEFGVYFFDPFYYENTEPFHESLRQCTGSKTVRGKLVTSYFSGEGTKQQFNFKQHTTYLVSICKQPGVKVVTNTTGVIVSMINSQYGFIKFGSAEKALFCAKSLFKDGWQFSGDPLKLPAMKFDGYQIPDTKSDQTYSWYAVLVWCGRRPSPKYCSTAEDLNSTPVFREGRLSTASSMGEGRKLRQPSSSMMVGQVVEIRKNGAVVRVREDGPDKVFVHGWKRQVANKSGTWLNTVTGECIGIGDLVAYYIDTEVMPGYSAVGKNVMVLKEKQEDEVKKGRRRRRNSSAVFGEVETASQTEGKDSDSGSELSVSEGELEWLEKDLGNMIAKEDPGAKTLNLLKGVHSKLQETRGKSGRRKSSRVRQDKPGYTPMVNQEQSFWRMKRLLASLDSGYRSDSDSDYEPGDEVEEVRRPLESVGDTETDSCFNTSQMSFEVKGKKRTLTTTSSVATSMSRERKSSVMGENHRLPYWVRALSLPEKFDQECGKFVPVDNAYSEDRDPDYVLPDSGTEEESEEEEVELEELLKEAEGELPEDVLEGKHKIDEKPVVSPVKVTLTPAKEGETEPEELEIITVDSKEPMEASPAPLPPLWVREMELVEQAEEYDSAEDPEYMPSAVIVDTDVDYDEFSDDQADLPDELTSLLADAAAPLDPPSIYLPIWVRVDSPEERIARAKESLASSGASLTVEENLQEETSGKDTEGDSCLVEAVEASCLIPAMGRLAVDRGSTSEEGEVAKEGPKPRRENKKKGGIKVAEEQECCTLVGEVSEDVEGLETSPKKSAKDVVVEKNFVEETV